ncbi:hypothetical protein GCM10023322_84040 [Rugosimonospora acidiphila]|uniref:Uncharacterized protein n=1 Tax=Rugosimonospora acidiphila TaxID=556531 RepID=A0ABP9ST21_9ACTN
MGDLIGIPLLDSFASGMAATGGPSHPHRRIRTGASAPAHPHRRIRTGASAPAHPHRRIRTGASAPARPYRYGGSLTPDTAGGQNTSTST